MYVLMDMSVLEPERDPQPVTSEINWRNSEEYREFRRRKRDLSWASSDSGSPSRLAKSPV